MQQCMGLKIPPADDTQEKKNTPRNGKVFDYKKESTYIFEII